MLTDTNLYVCVGRDYNKALPSGLIALDWTRQLLEIDIAKHDYRVALSEENLQSSHMWSSIEVDKGTLVLPLDLIFPLLRLQHAIHVVFGSTDLKPLMARELSLVEEIMSGKFHIPSTKEAKALSEGAASFKQGEKEKNVDSSRHQSGG